MSDSTITLAAIQQAFREVVDSANEANRGHAMNYMGLTCSLLLKGVITPEELEAGKECVKSVIDERFGPTPDEKQMIELRKLLDSMAKPKA